MSVKMLKAIDKSFPLESLEKGVKNRWRWQWLEESYGDVNVADWCKKIDFRPSLLSLNVSISVQEKLFFHPSKLKKLVFSLGALPPGPPNRVLPLYPIRALAAPEPRPIGPPRKFSGLGGYGFIISGAAEVFQ